jgi:hypothetical protein
LLCQKTRGEGEWEEWELVRQSKHVCSGVPHSASGFRRVVYSYALEGKGGLDTEFAAVIAEKEAVIAEKYAAIAEKDMLVEEKNTMVAWKDGVIERPQHEHSISNRRRRTDAEKATTALSAARPKSHR